MAWEDKGLQPPAAVPAGNEVAARLLVDRRPLQNFAAAVLVGKWRTSPRRRRIGWVNERHCFLHKDRGRNVPCPLCSSNHSFAFDDDLRTPWAAAARNVATPLRPTLDKRTALRQLEADTK